MLTAEEWGAGDGRLQAISDVLYPAQFSDASLRRLARSTARARRLRRVDAYVEAYLRVYREHQREFVV